MDATAHRVIRTDRHGVARLVLAYPDDAGIPLEFDTQAEADEYVAGANRRALVRDTGASYARA